MATQKNIPLKVVQWATGNIGTRSLRSVIEHPDLELVGLYVHSDNKVGQDAGTLCGTQPVGVQATNRIDDIIALKADCVLYMQQGCNVDDLCRILASGCNVVTTRVEFHHPGSLDNETRSRIEAACDAGGSSIYSTGSSPGFITEAIPLVLTSLQRRLDHLIIDEFADLTTRNSPELLFDIMGFGKPPSDFGEERLAHVKAGFAASLNQLADSIGMSLDEVTAIGEVATVKEDVHIAAGVLEAGTVGGQRITITGLRHGEALMQMRLNWYCTKELDNDWELRGNGWRVQVLGDTPMDVSILFSPIADEDLAATTPGYTAHRAVNAVSVVCGAKPGICTTGEMPQVIANLG
ncbi:dihydrodipicolinate reductase [Aestuariicella hydrocarbonica]|uniref:Dihydrodipicolinate reductase n=1 Tax=Pseudomaricurvus hydrocarbonicus TaxID=1470433 RepID=A0A9E5MK18_9GAMM|nr:dihydrodipicolinate reductase [Aestuariicella hydrocarbonica]NHO65919.1 dihydrodipicolinate reductase [Aestuariicella hydrocarbonica]